MIVSVKARAFLKSVLNGSLGIFVEILAAVLFISAGFLVCAFWWGLIR